MSNKQNSRDQQTGEYAYKTEMREFNSRVSTYLSSRPMIIEKTNN